ncbi:hypothetical protein O181_045151, partial [Austropuccinia psidii MF-1]|nr:hypothetical protein [Austropuccinia psidii MF-1]
SSIRESSSDSEASESNIEIQTSPAPRCLITKEPFKGPAEVEVTNPSNQIDLDQDIPVINQKDKNVNPEERDKWRMPELPPVAKDDNSISFITRQLKELRIKAQNLENSTGHNAALFQEQLEKRDKERLELKEYLQSSINNISLKNDFPRQSTPIHDRNVLNLNNDCHHTISSNVEGETACNFEDIPRLEEWPTFSG